MVHIVLDPTIVEGLVMIGEDNISYSLPITNYCTVPVATETLNIAKHKPIDERTFDHVALFVIIPLGTV